MARIPIADRFPGMLARQDADSSSSHVTAESGWAYFFLCFLSVTVDLLIGSGSFEHLAARCDRDADLQLLVTFEQGQTGAVELQRDRAALTGSQLCLR